MKKYLYLALLAVLISACSAKEAAEEVNQEMEGKVKVAFNIIGATIDTTPMDGPKRAQILDDENGAALTDLILFDGTTIVEHQTNDNPNFGTIETTLSLGEHHLHFVASRSAGADYANGIMTCTALRPTFGKHLDLNITGANVNESIELKRITGQFYITIDDAIPNDLDSIAFELETRYTDFYITTFDGANGQPYRAKADVVSKRNQTGVTYNFIVLAETYGEQYTTDLTIISYKHDGSRYVRVVKDVPLATNTKTLLHGELYGGETSSITVDITWEDPLQGSM